MIKSDKWIRRVAKEHAMIEPFEPGQVRRNASGGRLDTPFAADAQAIAQPLRAMTQGVVAEPERVREARVCVACAKHRVKTTPRFASSSRRGVVARP